MRGLARITRKRARFKFMIELLKEAEDRIACLVLLLEFAPGSDYERVEVIRKAKNTQTRLREFLKLKSHAEDKPPA
jgi:hypothetical protein